MPSLFAEQVKSRLIDSLVFCGLPQEAAEQAVARLGNWIDSAHPQAQVGDALEMSHWLDWLRHRCDEFAAVNTAVLLRGISRAVTAGATQSSPEVVAFVKNLQIPAAQADLVVQLLALPGSNTPWSPSTADESVLLDVERCWFGDPSPRYLQRAAAIRAQDSSTARDDGAARRLANLTALFESGLIFFLPETRSALEGRAFLNLSLEIAAIRTQRATTG